MRPDADELSLGVTEFVTLLNQTFDFAYPSLLITGELANLRISKNKWVYFDLKDDASSVKFFGTVYQLPGPLEDGMLLKVRGAPRLHNQYGFSVTVQTMQPAGEGTIKRAAELLLAKLKTEGLFEATRKRPLPYPPNRVGLIASKQSAAYADFVKIIHARWSGLVIEHIDVQVQGEIAPKQIINAIKHFNSVSDPVEVIIIIRGGGSPEDLAAFSTEPVTRAVAASRIPTMVGIGHEVDISLAELAADKRASTPSNAAELLVPDRLNELHRLKAAKKQLEQQGINIVLAARRELGLSIKDLKQVSVTVLDNDRKQVESTRRVLALLDPAAVLRRGYAIVRQDAKVIRTSDQFITNKTVLIQFSDGQVEKN